MKNGCGYPQYAEQLKKLMAQKEIEKAIDVAGSTCHNPASVGMLETEVNKISFGCVFVREGGIGPWNKSNSPEGMSIISDLGGPDKVKNILAQ